MEYRAPYRGDRIELGEARQEHDQCQRHARGRQRLLRLRSDQEESRHRIEFPRAGLNGIALISTGISIVVILIRNANFLNIEWLSQLTGSLPEKATNGRRMYKSRNGRADVSRRGSQYYAVDFLKHIQPGTINLGRPFGPENLAHRTGDHAKEFSEQFARRAIGVGQLHLAADHPKVAGAIAGKIQHRIDGQ